ncbi:hypothetical protein BH11ACT3_BH11ACT3_05830 [soil metagenome]
MHALTWKLDAPGVDIAGEIAVALNGQLPLEQAMRRGEFAAVMQSAAMGNLFLNGKSLRPITRDPDIYELRWKFGSRLYRMYHAEPSRFPEDLIALRFHEKLTAGLTDAEVHAAQQDEISLAIVRYHAGDPHDWGL